MARLPRYFIPGAAMHVIQRGNDRKAIFAADEDYVAYLDWLKIASRENGLEIHAYALMTNHVHLLVTPKAKDSIGAALQSLGRRYVRYFNAAYQRTGTLWEGRYRATIVDTEPYLLVCSRYIELNPVRAGMAPDPGLYRWSSYRYNARAFCGGSCVRISNVHGPRSFADHRAATWLRLFERGIEEQEITQIRNATNKGCA